MLNKFQGSFLMVLMISQLFSFSVLFQIISAESKLGYVFTLILKFRCEIYPPAEYFPRSLLPKITMRTNLLMVKSNEKNLTWKLTSKYSALTIFKKPSMWVFVTNCHRNPIYHTKLLVIENIRASKIELGRIKDRHDSISRNGGRLFHSSRWAKSVLEAILFIFWYQRRDFTR